MQTIFAYPRTENPNQKVTIVKPVYKSKEQYQKLLQEHVEQLSALHQLRPLCCATLACHARRRDEENAHLIVFHIILETLKALKMAYSKPTAKHRQKLQVIRKPLAK